MNSLKDLINKFIDGDENKYVISASTLFIVLFILGILWLSIFFEIF